MWGASTAAHQIEGNNTNSDWWCKEIAGAVKEPSLDACDSYHRWREDMDLLAGLGFTDYRFSIEWARIEPAPGHFSRAELAHYRRMVEGAVERGLRPMVTLHHFTVPQWFEDRGGWTADGAVERLERHHGFWLNWYDAHDGSVLTTWPESGDPVRPFLSSVDNAWLVTGLRIAAHADPALRPRVARLLEAADWSYFYTPYDPADPAGHPGQLRGGFWTDNGEPTGHHYGALNTEPRMASYLGIADGTLPGEHYWHMYRTMLPEWEQEQSPGGAYVTVDGFRIWNGNYSHRGRKLVPTWGGSMFEALMVPLFVPESEWSPHAWGTTHSRYVRSQIEHGLIEQAYGYWGFSPASIPQGGYREYGVDAIGQQADGYHPLGVVTPHASFLALPYAPAEAVGNLTALAHDFGAYDEEYGFRDSVDVVGGRVSDAVLALDQGMICAAIAQRLRPGLLQQPFRTGGFAARVRPLLARERFSI
ncbi:family 1 glycosylhydrolase [Streptomyces sp. NBC_01217]|uniref:family 1 glycosylhydrolase n=1 Tax=Streptomyces sp. NBC_01217 TaxID=2903779 RepID=UPI002E106629|nr:family 1 glycosylhydrolase [Streptomyces sp. NBC_01217]